MKTLTAGWYPDPSYRFAVRFWNGARWTEHVADGGRVAVDSLQARSGAEIGSAEVAHIEYVVQFLDDAKAASQVDAATHQRLRARALEARARIGTPSPTPAPVHTERIETRLPPVTRPVVAPSEPAAAPVVVAAPPVRRKEGRDRDPDGRSDHTRGV